MSKLDLGALVFQKEPGSSGVGLGPPCPGSSAPKGRGGTEMSLKENSPTYPLGQMSGFMDYQTPPLLGSFFLHYCLWAVPDASEAKFK